MTWQRDSHNLFDYESRNIVHESLNVEDSCTLIYSNNQVKVLEDCEESCKVLARIEKVNQNPDCPSFIVKPAEEE